MKGVVLAGGLGTRLAPLTNITNKHLLPVWDRPMIYYPLEYLVKLGIDEVLIVTGGNYAGRFIDMLKGGKDLGIKRLEYAYQEGEGGIADALKLAKGFAGDSSICVVLGDNIYQHVSRYALNQFERSDKEAAVFVQPIEVCDVSRAANFGVLFSEDDVFKAIVEKPSIDILESRLCSAKNRQQGYIITGSYMYKPGVFDVCDKLVPSSRGELEISDVNRHFLSREKLAAYLFSSWWIDAGSFENLNTASKFVKEHGANK